jgi:hypothetical protein
MCVSKRKVSACLRWRKAHADRVNRERQARETAKVYRAEQRQRARDSEEQKQCTRCLRTLPLSSFSRMGDRLRSACKQCDAAECRRRRRRAQGKTGSGFPRGTVSPERRREAAERIAHLVSLLNGSASGERIDNEHAWEVTVAELQRLWLQSGDKECASCSAVVPPTEMRPPGPASFYPGQCRKCAHTAWEASHRATYGPLIGPLRGAPRLRMKDGTFITVASFARRVREREKSAQGR